MSNPDRRTAIKQLLAAAASLAVAPPLSLFGAPTPQRERPTGEEHQQMAAVGRKFMNQFFAPALSVAIVRNGAFVFERPFGMADKEAQLPTAPTTLFRIASVTKPFTSVAIFTLVEQGKLNLNDKVFGSSGVLDNMYGKPPYKQYVTDITVDNLLTHTSGGWPNDSTDPMFRFNSWSQAKLITWTLANLPLTYPPGTHWAYSNFGYCVRARAHHREDHRYALQGLRPAGRADAVRYLRHGDCR
jgi:CubicO group peptidase (beta-lactamase class C family)